MGEDPLERMSRTNGFAIKTEATALLGQIIKKMPKAKGTSWNLAGAGPGRGTPWQYRDASDEGGVQGRGAAQHYPTMSIAELCELDVKSICGQDAVLFLWVTSPLLFE